MAGITLADAQAQLTAWLAASAAVAGNQEYEIATAGGGSRRLRRADAAAITAQIDYWDRKVKELSAAAGGGLRRITYVEPQ